MTLADFARSIGISPATAQQWKKRGKIVERDGEHMLIAEAQRRDSLIGTEVTSGAGVTGKVVAVDYHTVTVDSPGGPFKGIRFPYEFRPPSMRKPDSVTLHNEATGESVTVPADSLKPGSVTPMAVTACKCGKLLCPTCGPVIPCGVTVDNRTARGAIGNLVHPERDYDPETVSRADCRDRRTKTEIALEERVTALEASNESIRQDMLTLYREMRDRCGALETEVAFLRTRLGQPDAPVATYTTSRGPIDPPGPNWGA